MSTTREHWIWWGTAGHFICRSDCRYHLFTTVGRWLVSTVGDYHPRHKQGKNGEGKAEEIGCGRKYETFVFDGQGGGECECGCGTPRPASFSEIDSLPANDFKTAHENHYAMCEKWSQIQEPQP